MRLMLLFLLLIMTSSAFGQTQRERLEFLFQKWGSEDPKSREAADSEALDVLRPIVTSDIQPLLGVLTSALNNRNTYVRLQACKILAVAAINYNGNAIALQKVEPLLVTLADDKDIEVKRAALGALVLIAPRPSESSLQVFLDLVKDSDREVRAMALIGLVKYGWQNQEVRDAYIWVLKYDSDEMIRGDAARALGGDAAGSETIGALISALGDRSQYVREGAVTSLGRLGSTARPALPALKRALENESESELMRSSLKDAISKIEGK